MKLIRPLPLLLLCALLLAGCGQEGGALQEQETAQTQTGPTWESRTPSEAFQGIQGCAVLYDLGTDHYTLYQEDLCRTQVSPCSTFKILSTLMGLHTGVLTGPESTMTYSGIQYPVAAWNGNLTLAEAFQSSCVWYFRQVIDQVGQASVAQQLAALDYGNQDISQWEGGGQNQSPELNGFWIDSSLKISPWSRSRSSPKFLRAAASTPRRRWTPSGPSCWSRMTGPGRSTARRAPALERPAGSWASRRRPGPGPTSRSTWPTRAPPSPAARPGRWPLPC